MKRNIRSLAIILTAIAAIAGIAFFISGDTAQAKAGGSDATKIVYNCVTRSLCVMNADGSGQYQITNPNGLTQSVFSPRFDADAEKIVFLSRVDISQGNLRYRLAIVNTDGTNAMLLFDGEQYDANDHSVNTLGISPDGSKIAFVTYPRNGSSINKILWVINSDGSGLRQLFAGDIFADFPLFTNGIHQSNARQDISFSPDGRKIAVSINDSGALYNVFSIRVDGKGITQLTNAQNPASFIDPLFSPDGSKIVFTENGLGGLCRLLIMNADGTNQIALAEGGQNFVPSFNPSGSKITYLSTRNSPSPVAFFTYDIYTVNPDGTNETRLTFNESPAKTSLPSFDPFGEKIVFSYTPDGGFQSAEVFTMNPDGTSVTALTDSPGDSNAVNPSYGNGDLDGDGVKNTLDNCRLVQNPNQTNTDGDVEGNSCDADDDNDGIDDEFDNCPLAVNYYRVAFSSGLFIYTMNESGSGRTQLTFGPTTYREIEPEFNRDGSRIVFQSNRINNRNEIYSMKPDGTDITQLTNIAGGNQQPSYSPDGSKIVFSSRRTRPNNQGSTDLYVMNADGSNQVGLGIATNTFAAENPTFNQDGTRIAYFAGRLTGSTNTQDIYTINPDGTIETRLTSAAGVDKQPAFSPDGSKIAFVSFRGGDPDGEIYVMNADGTNQTRLTDDTREDRNPTFTPDGTKITFNDRVDSQLSRINVDGTGLVRLTNSFGYLSPSYTTQPDADRDGTGDTCDPHFDAVTPAGKSVNVAGPNVTVEFSSVVASGSTSFTPIQLQPGDLPLGYALCPTCPAYEITTTAGYTPPIEVCLAVPAAVSQPNFLTLRLMHGENGVFVDRTTSREDDGQGNRSICGTVSSLSPFALASPLVPTAASVTVTGRLLDSSGRAVHGATVSLIGSNGVVFNALSNPFGYFSFEGVMAGQTYAADIRHRIFSFESQTITVTDDVTDLIIVANP
jgi:Periplasmic component of the Tol biopolymer transport system